MLKKKSKSIFILNKECLNFFCEFSEMIMSFRKIASEFLMLH